MFRILRVIWLVQYSTSLFQNEKRFSALSICVKYAGPWVNKCVFRLMGNGKCMQLSSFRPPAESTRNIKRIDRYLGNFKNRVKIEEKRRKKRRKNEENRRKIEEKINEGRVKTSYVKLGFKWRKQRAATKTTRKYLEIKSHFWKK